jgi:autotransporter-associated beta strand protein
MSDDAGYNEFGFTNQITGVPSTFAVTPRLDELASQSVVMREGYVAAAICTTSRLGMLLGQYQQRYGMEENLSNNINETFGLSGQATMPSRLKVLGYNTGAIGKWHLGYVDGLNRPQDVGFDEYFGFLSGSRGNYFAGEGNPANVIRDGDTPVESSWANASNGGYVTDAFGLKAVDFINNHANSAAPFFLYVAFNAPHDVWAGGPNGNGTTVADYNHPQIAQISDPTSRTIAALNHGIDRNVGRIMDALEDQGIDDNTIVVFLNDNGGPSYSSYSPPHANNEPFGGFKGYTMEGGIRVPFLIKAPGISPGVYNAPVSAYDLLPTFLAAAGGDAPEDAVGVDLMPYLSGAASGDPHETLIWRGRNKWAIRKGDMKLSRPIDQIFSWPYLTNLGQNVVETEATNQFATQTAIAAELLRDFTMWEATVKKPLWGVLGANDRNQFDHFVFRNDVASVTTWSTPNAWLQAGTASTKTFRTDDAYANAILEFGTRNDANYTASNDLGRMSGLTFMLNQMRLTGNFTGTATRVGTINAGAWNSTINGRASITSTNDLLFVKSLTGTLPRLQLDAISTDTAAGFKFLVTHNLQLLDDLEIVGDGTQEFVFSGSIRDYHAPRNVVKSGSSRITLQGANTFHGSLTINGGEVRVAGAAAALDGPSEILIASGGRLRLDQGRVATLTLETALGGEFLFHGGRLEVNDVFGDLVNSGGTFAVGGDSVVLGTVSGDFAQSAGRIDFDLGAGVAGVGYDTLAIGGTATIGGVLDVDFTSGFAPTFGQRFDLISAAHVKGNFSGYDLPALSGGTRWSLQNDGQIVSLIVGLTGDYNGNGRVDAADYTVWRNSLGQPVPPGTLADGNGSAMIDDQDYLVWRQHFGAIAIASGSGASFPVEPTAVPEPTTLVLIALAATSGRRLRRYARRM